MSSEELIRSVPLGEGGSSNMGQTHSSARQHLEGSSQLPSYQAVTDEAVTDEAYSDPATTTTPLLSFPRKFAYGVGHVFNDLCASMWFTYLVLFFHKVVDLPNTYAGLLILIGQVADAMATPFIGYLCDKTHIRYGRRKFWHLVGSIMVAVSLFFFWHTCLPCDVISKRQQGDDTGNSTKNETGVPLAVTVVYFSIPIIIFQFGWASVQISHLSLIPELTSDKNERVGLNAIRYAFTILSNVGVYVTMFLLLLFVGGTKNTKFTSLNVWIFHHEGGTNLTAGAEEGGEEGGGSSESDITPGDVWIFSGTALGIIVIGGIFSFIFQVGTHEPYIPPEKRKTQYTEGTKIKWYLWFTKPQFYLVAAIYMCTRLINNMIQAYTPLYLLESLSLSKTSVAIGPLVIFVSGFLTTLLLKILNRVIGRYMVYFLGIALIWAGLLWFQLMTAPGSSVGMNVVVYGSTVLVGAGGATILVTSLSMVADLIDIATGSAAFVYGLMSFTDKLSSGVVIQIIQALHPCKSKSCCAACTTYYRKVLVLVPGAASALAVVSLALVVLLIFVMKKRQMKQLTITSINTGTSSRYPAPRSVSPMIPPVKNNGVHGTEGSEVVDEGEKKPLISHSYTGTQ